MMVTKSNPYVGFSSSSDRGLENCGSGLCSCPAAPAVEELERIKTELLSYISHKDWGMAEFFASTLQDSVRQLVESTESLPHSLP